MSAHLTEMPDLQEGPRFGAPSQPQWLSNDCGISAGALAPNDYPKCELLSVGERERKRIGRDLHDGLGQYLHAVYYMAALLYKQLRVESSPSTCRALQLVKQMEEALDVTRCVARGLQPVGSMPDSLMRALADLAEGTVAVYRIDCRFEAASPVLVECPAAANHLYRIAQEAVSNAVKHGRPTRIRIKLSADEESIILSIWDNGTGIKTRNKRGDGMGLPSMQQRAVMLNGSVAIRRARGGGTQVICRAARRDVSAPDKAVFQNAPQKAVA